MRWMIVVLVLINIGVGIWGGIGYGHAKDRWQASAAERDKDMPGVRLVLLNERQQQKSVVGVGEQPELVDIGHGLSANHGEKIELALTDTPKYSDQKYCVRIGAFEDVEAVRGAVAYLEGLSLASKVLDVEREGEVSFWVYLAPETTRELALTKLRELQDKKVDSFIIPRGDLENGISLGVFEGESEAARRQQEVAALGYEVKLQLQKRKYVEHWLEINADSVLRISDDIHGQLKAHFASHDIRKEVCGSVASPSHIQ